MCVVGQLSSHFWPVPRVPSSLFGTLLLDRRLRPRYRHASDGAQITIAAESRKSVDSLNILLIDFTWIAFYCCEAFLSSDEVTAVAGVRL